MTTTERRPLTRELVIETAVAFADANGIEEMSMRRLGAELGVEAMALYNHVDNKDDLLTGMIDYVFEDIARPEASLPWQEQLRLIGRSAISRFMEHSWAGMLVANKGNFGAGSLRFMDHVLGLLLEAGFSDDDTHHAWCMMSAHTLGYAFQSMAADGVTPDDPAHLEDNLPRLRREVPNVARISPLTIDCSWETEYEFGLEIIIDGLETRLNG